MPDYQEIRVHTDPAYAVTIGPCPPATPRW